MDGQQNVPQSDEPAWQFHPGETISPRTQQAQAAAAPAPVQETPTTAPVAPPAPELQPVPAAAAPSQEQPPAPDPQPITAPETPVPQFTPQIQDVPVENNDQTEEAISWTASEFIAHHKTPGWHLFLIAGSVVAAVIVWLLFRDIVSSAVVIIAGIALSAYGGRSPRQLEYRLDHRGITIGPKYYPFEVFRSFSLAPEGAFGSINLMPAKRFAPSTSLYYDPQDEDHILYLLGAHLPQEEHRADAVDALMRRIRF